MAITFNPAGDWQVVDGLETITLFRRVAPGGYDGGESVEHCLRRAAAIEELAAVGAELAKTGLIWHLWNVNVAGADPKVNDVIQDAQGKRWSVLAVDDSTLRTRFRCTTVRER